MNWYNLYKQASPPLPVTVPKKWMDEHIEYGVEKTDREMSQETADKEKKRDPKFFSGGSWGMIVQLADDKVMKYIFDEKEANLAKSLIGNTKYPVVKIFDVVDVQDDPPIWGVIMEKLTSYWKVDPKERMWPKIEGQLLKQLIPIRLDWDLNPKNLGFDRNGKPVIFDLGLQHAH